MLAQVLALQAREADSNLKRENASSRIFSGLMTDVGGLRPWGWGKVTLVVLSCIRGQSEQTMRNKPYSSMASASVLSPGSSKTDCMISLLLAEKNPSLPKLPSVTVFYHSNRQVDRNWTRAWTVAMIDVVMYFSIYLFFHILYPNCSFFSLHSQFFLHLPRSTPPPPFPFGKEQAHRDINGTCIISYNKTGCIPLYKGWTRQPRRRKGVLEAAERDRDTLPLPLLGVCKKTKLYN